MASKPFEARYYNKSCPVCEWPIHAGEMARYNDLGNFVHADCCDEEVTNPYFDNWWNKAPKDVLLASQNIIKVTAPQPEPTKEEDEPVTIYCYQCGERLKIKPQVIKMRTNSNGYLVVDFDVLVADHVCPQPSRPQDS